MRFKEFLCERTLTKKQLKAAMANANDNTLCVFNINNHNLTSLEGCPEEINVMFDASYNLLTSIDHIPRVMKSNCNLTQNNIENLKDIHKKIDSLNGYIALLNNPIKSHILRIAARQGFENVDINT